MISPRYGRVLSQRPEQVIRLLVTGKTYKQIALELGCATTTVRGSMSRAIEDLGATDKTTAVLKWIQTDEHLNEVASRMHERYPDIHVQTWRKIAGEVVEELLK